MRELWSVTSRSEGGWIRDWLDCVGELLPGQILVAHDPDAPHFIDEAEEMMEKWGVPLPVDEAVQFLLTQKDFLLGKPFDGLRLSHLSKKF